MTDHLDKVLDKIKEPSQLQDVIKQAKSLETKCDKNASVIHENCFDADLLVPQCPKALINLIIKTIASRPSLVDDNVKFQISDYFKTNNIKAQGLVSQDILTTLYSGSESQLITWVKYEAILSHLIREFIYEPKTMASEVLQTVKNELDPRVAAKFSSVLNECVKFCREINNRHAFDEEEEEKWCEIIDWMSWFLVNDDMESV